MAEALPKIDLPPINQPKSSPKRPDLRLVKNEDLPSIPTEAIEPLADGELHALTAQIVNSLPAGFPNNLVIDILANLSLNHEDKIKALAQEGRLAESVHQHILSQLKSKDLTAYSQYLNSVDLPPAIKQVREAELAREKELMSNRDTLIATQRRNMINLVPAQTELEEQVLQAENHTLEQLAEKLPDQVENVLNYFHSRITNEHLKQRIRQFTLDWVKLPTSQPLLSANEATIRTNLIKYLVIKLPVGLQDDFKKVYDITAEDEAARRRLEKPKASTPITRISGPYTTEELAVRTQEARRMFDRNAA